MLIDGKQVPAVFGKIIAVYNAATGGVIANVPEGDKADVDLAVAVERRAFDERRWLRVSPSERRRILWRISDLIERDLEELAELESIDNGKPYAVARVADLPLAVDMFPYMGGWATKITGSTLPLSLPGEYLSYTVREPVGVVGQIIQWNFPLLMAAWKITPALAAGCTIMLKAAEQMSLTALGLAELIVEAGVPAGVINILTGFGEAAGAALAAHPDVDKVAFTGSIEVGKLIVQAAAGNLKKVSLELGGKSPATSCRTRISISPNCRCGKRDLLQPRAVLLRRFATVCPQVGIRAGGGRCRRHRRQGQGRGRPGPCHRDGTFGIGRTVRARHRLYRGWSLVRRQDRGRR
jgi:acyl-CoA reductase-like NAD-dependent aldehyde dehydrogenase